MVDPFPPAAFHFQISLTPDGDEVLVAQEMSGLEAPTEAEGIAEGENRFVHRLPKRVTSANIVVKRGIVRRDTALFTWVKSTLSSDFSAPIVSKTLHIALLDAKDQPMLRWHVFGAYPVKWQMSGFDAQEKEVAIESIEFAFTRVERGP